MEEIKVSKLNQPKKLQLIPAGIYRAVLTDIKSVKSKKGRPMQQLLWEITEDNYIGRKIKSFIIMDSNLTKRILEVIISNMGYEPDDTEISQLIGKECRIQIEKKNTSFGMVNSVEYYHSIFTEFEY